MTRAALLVAALALVGCSSPQAHGPEPLDSQDYLAQMRVGALYAGGPTPAAAIRQAFGPVRARGGAEGDVLTLSGGVWVPAAAGSPTLASLSAHATGGSDLTITAGDDLLFGTTVAATQDSLTIDWAGEFPVDGQRLSVGGTAATQIGHDGTGTYFVLPLNGNFVWLDGPLADGGDALAAFYTATAAPGRLFIDGGALQFSEGGAGLAAPTPRLLIDGGVADFFATVLQGTEQSDAGAPDANGYRVYARDNGGKTELVARFNSGAIQRLAIEP